MEKLNIAEILKDCPKGMELDCTMFDDVTFFGVYTQRDFPIEIKVAGATKYLTKEGCYHRLDCIPSAKCVIFPKGKTTWEGFQRPFKDGDVIISSFGGIHILKNSTTSYCYFDRMGILTKTETSCVRVDRLASNEEKQKLFDAIKANGYKWNAETKTLEKLIEPKFEVGDKIKKKGDTRLITIKDVRDNYYIITILDSFGNCYITDKLSFSNQDDYELLPNKFDIATLKPFESKVLVRDYNSHLWKPAFFGFIKNEKDYHRYYVVGGINFLQCIPYEGNEHLRGTANDCEEYYKIWE